jgi:GPH family glycoside/pentoside/hexuronide:cation symporter
VIFAGALKASAIMLFYAMPLDAVWPQTFVQYGVGIGFGMLMVLAYAMFTDIAEYVDWRSRKQMTALVVAASIFAVKTGVAFGLALPGLVMSMTGFEAGQEQSEAAIMGINLAFAIIPAMALVPGGIAMFFYHLDRRTIAKIETELAQRRQMSA